MSGIRTVETDLSCHTEGLRRHHGCELRVSYANERLVRSAREFLTRAGRYIEGGARVKTGQTMSHGSWVLQFRERDGMLDVWELEDWNAFVRGATRALTLWDDQKLACERAGSDFDPPLADRKACVSEGVLDGDPVEGVRYRAPAHMSGWYLTTEKCDDDIASMKVVHLYHVFAARPELAGLLGLAPGFYFDYARRVGFSAEVAAESP